MIDDQFCCNEVHKPSSSDIQAIVAESQYCRPQRSPAFGRPRKFHAKRGCPKPEALFQYGHWGAVQALGRDSPPGDMLNNQMTIFDIFLIYHFNFFALIAKCTHNTCRGGHLDLWPGEPPVTMLDLCVGGSVTWALGLDSPPAILDEQYGGHSGLRPNPHRTRDAMHAQIQTFHL